MKYLKFGTVDRHANCWTEEQEKETCELLIFLKENNFAVLVDKEIEDSGACSSE